MTVFLRWTLRVLTTLLLFMAFFALAIWIADPAVLRNLLYGLNMSDVSRIQNIQPQESVPSTERNDIALGESNMFAASGIAAAETYAAETGSVALLIYQAGALRYEKYWSKHSQHTRTNPNSAHKTVLGLLVGAAIEDGYIHSVDDSAARYLPEWAQDERKKIKIRDLLQMASGLEIPKFGRWTSLQLTLGSDLSRTALGLKSNTLAGSDFQYSNVNAQLLAIIVERATGKRYAQYLADRLWSRLGAAPASLWLDHVNGIPRGFCCLFASARDWLRVGRLFLERGRVGTDQVVPAQWIEDMITPSLSNKNYGYQVWLGSPQGTQRKYNDSSPSQAFHSSPFAAPDIIFIDGFGGQRVYIVPSLELIIVRTGRVIFNWDDAILPNEIIHAMHNLSL